MKGDLLLELLQLYYFQVTAKYQHISKAAAHLHITQPALSQTIKRLEKELETDLFDRVGKDIVLNPKGEILLKYANTILASVDNAKNEIADFCSKESHTLSLSVQSASLFLPTLLQRFRKLHPETLFRIFQNTETMGTEKYDLTIYSSIQEPKDDHHLILLQEKLVVALPKEHPLANKPNLTFADLADESFITLGKGTNLYNIITHYCNESNFWPSTFLYCDNPNTLRELINLNFGISLIPEITWNCRYNSSIATRELSDVKCRRNIILSWNPETYLSRLAYDFRDMTVDFFNELA